MMISTVEKPSKLNWGIIGRALGGDLRENKVIRGASGIDHLVDAICVDDQANRVIIISSEQSARVAALTQADIQATMPSTKVLLTRPIAFDFASIARNAVQKLGIIELNLNEFTKSAQLAKESGVPLSAEMLKAVTGPIFMALEKVELPPLNQFLAFIQQAALIGWKQIHKSIEESPNNVAIPLGNLLTVDSMAADRKLGICSIPLYEFSEKDWDLFLSGTDIDEVAERLKEMGIFQYFYPPADQIALGVIERAGASTVMLSNAIEAAPEIGHPLGTPEIIKDTIKAAELIERLQDAGLVVEGELGMEATEKGSAARAIVKFRPRESFLTKLLQRLSLNLSVSPKDFLPPHP